MPYPAVMNSYALLVELCHPHVIGSSSPAETHHKVPSRKNLVLSIPESDGATTAPSLDARVSHGIRESQVPSAEMDAHTVRRSPLDTHQIDHVRSETLDILAASASYISHPWLCHPKLRSGLPLPIKSYFESRTSRICLWPGLLNPYRVSQCYA